MRYLTLVAVFAMLVLCRPQNSSAAAMDDYPAGSYQQTCRNISLRGDDLRARCQDTRGHYRDAFFDGADRCWGDISNNDGRLVCNKNGTLPGGGYSQSCRDIRVRYNVLVARCQDRDGRWVDSFSNPLAAAAARLKISMASFAAWTTVATMIVTGTAIGTGTATETTMAIATAIATTTAAMARVDRIPRAAAISRLMEILFALSARR